METATVATYPAVMKVDQAAAYLGIAKWTLYHWVSERKKGLRFVKIGRVLRFRKIDLDKFLRLYLRGNAS